MHTAVCHQANDSILQLCVLCKRNKKKTAPLCKVMESLEIHVVVGADGSSILFFFLKNEYTNVAPIRKRDKVSRITQCRAILATSLSLFYSTVLLPRLQYLVPQRTDNSYPADKSLLIQRIKFIHLRHLSCSKIG